MEQNYLQTKIEKINVGEFSDPKNYCVKITNQENRNKQQYLEISLMDAIKIGFIGEHYMFLHNYIRNDNEQIDIKGLNFKDICNIELSKLYNKKYKPNKLWKIEQDGNTFTLIRLSL